LGLNRLGLSQEQLVETLCAAVILMRHEAHHACGEQPRQ
jgi:hypothetical protein